MDDANDLQTIFQFIFNLNEEIVKRNGKEDPLKKTLIIIDEAHKLLSDDLKPQERPNFSILKKFIHNSYEKSKKDSVRVLLMTATPYTTNPSTLIKLLKNSILNFYI